MQPRMILAILLTGALIVMVGIRACSTESTDGGGPEEWSYEGATGPDHWADLSPDYVLARTGQKQSPIDIATADAIREEAPPIVLDYHPTTLDVVHNGHSIQDDYTGGGFLEIEGQRYDLAQFHVHSPSEHTIDGKPAAAELHFVHKNESGELLVLGVLIEEGAETAFIHRVQQYIPQEPGRANHVEGVLVDASELMPKSLASYRYEGSLTTPPCSEGVRWIVLREPIESSPDQIERLRKTIPKNNRPTQPLHGRRVVATD